MKLEPGFRDFVELLNKYTVEYMAVGGYALAFHGKPRFTAIWISGLTAPKPMLKR